MNALWLIHSFLSWHNAVSLRSFIWIIPTAAVFPQLGGRLSIYSSHSLLYLHLWLSGSVKERLSERLYKQRCYQHKPYKGSLSNLCCLGLWSLRMAFPVTWLVGFDAAVADVWRTDLWITSCLSTSCLFGETLGQILSIPITLISGTVYSRYRIHMELEGNGFFFPKAQLPKATCLGNVCFLSYYPSTRLGRATREQIIFVSFVRNEW